MAKVRINPVIRGIHGRIGGMIFRGSANGEMIVHIASRKKEKKSKKPLTRQQLLMQEAHDYAHTAMADPALRVHYEQAAKRKKKSAYHMVLSHYFKVHRKLGE